MQLLLCVHFSTLGSIYLLTCLGHNPRSRRFYFKRLTLLCPLKLMLVYDHTYTFMRLHTYIYYSWDIIMKLCCLIRMLSGKCEKNVQISFSRLSIDK